MAYHLEFCSVAAANARNNVSKHVEHASTCRHHSERTDLKIPARPLHPPKLESTEVSPTLSAPNTEHVKQTHLVLSSAKESVWFLLVVQRDGSQPKASVQAASHVDF